MGFAEAVDCPVLLVADIDRGGALAHVVGTLACLSESERGAHRRHRDQSLPRRHRACSSRAWSGSSASAASRCSACCRICTAWCWMPRMLCRKSIAQNRDRPRFPHRRAGLSPHQQPHRLRCAAAASRASSSSSSGPAMRCRRATSSSCRGARTCAPTSSSSRRRAGARRILRHVRYGGRVIGICGGMQMLGTRIDDPHGVEGPAGSSDGLGLARARNHPASRKSSCATSTGHLDLGPAFSGYEIHMGTSHGAALERPAASIDGRPEGAMSADGRILAHLCAWHLRRAGGLRGAAGLGRHERRSGRGPRGACARRAWSGWPTASRKSWKPATSGA